MRWHLLKRQFVEWGSLALLAAIVLVPGGILAWLIFSTDTFIVQSVTIVDAREDTEEEMRARTQELIGKRILFLQTERIAHVIEREIPQIRNIHITRKLPGTVKIVVQEKEPSLLLLSGKTYYFVDQEGIPYEQARLDILPGIALPTVKNSDQTTQVKLGAPALSRDFISFVLQAEQHVSDVLGAHVAELRIPSLATREVHVRLDNNLFIRFDTTRPFESQLSVLRRLLEHTISREDLPNVEYIDLRIQNRVYYKLRTNST